LRGATSAVLAEYSEVNCAFEKVTAWAFGIHPSWYRAAALKSTGLPHVPPIIESSPYVVKDMEPPDDSYAPACSSPRLCPACVRGAEAAYVRHPNKQEAQRAGVPHSYAPTATAPRNTPQHATTPRPLRTELMREDCPLNISLAIAGSLCVGVGLPIAVGATAGVPACRHAEDDEPRGSVLA
jgi:hypothetical protein